MEERREYPIANTQYPISKGRQKEYPIANTQYPISKGRQKEYPIAKGRHCREQVKALLFGYIHLGRCPRLCY
jgi:hypothetical protein